MTSAPTPPLSRAWLVVGLLWVVGAFNYFDRNMLMTMHASIVGSIPMTETQFGLLTTSFLWVYAFLSPLAGFMADRFSRSRVVIISIVVWSAVTLLTSYAKTFPQLLVMRAIMGISEAAYLPAGLALIMDYHRGATRSLAVGVHMTGISFGSACGFVGGWMAEGHGWAYPFRLFGAIGIVYGILLLATLRDAPREGVEINRPKVHFGSALTSLFSRGAFVMALIFWGLLGFVGWAVNGWMPTYFSEHFHLAQGEGAFRSMGIAQIAGLCGMLIGGAWADRWSRTLPRARILVPFFGLCVAAPCVFWVAHTPVLLFASIGMALSGCCRNFTDPNMMPIVCLVSDVRYRATGYGVLNMFSCFVGGIAIYLGGVVRDRHIDVSLIFTVASGSMLFCAFLLLLIRPGPTSALIPAAEGEPVPVK